jgi:hypothetical protein
MPSATPGRRPYSSCNPSPHCTGLAMSLPFLPFRASAPIERPISLSRITAVSLLPASIGKESAFPNDHFGADYRIQLLSLHLANLSSPRSSRCRAPIRAVDWTLPEGIRTLSTREPFPGSRLATAAPSALDSRLQSGQHLAAKLNESNSRQRPEGPPVARPGRQAGMKAKNSSSAEGATLQIPGTSMSAVRGFSYVRMRLRMSMSFFITPYRLPLHSRVPKASCSVRYSSNRSR